VEAPLQTGMSAETLARFTAKVLTIEDGRRGQSTLGQEANNPLTLLLCVTAFVLLIACANIANLLLARAAGRAGEMAVRLSIGASRRHLVGQLLTESLVLSVLGGTAGVVFTLWTLHFIATLTPPDTVEILTFGLDVPVLLVVGGLAIATG